MTEATEAIAAVEPTDAELDEMCEALAEWSASRKFYREPSLPVSVLGRLTAERRPYLGKGRNGVASAQLRALNLALAGQPKNALDRRVFELHYFERPGSVKELAHHLAVSRQHYYRLLRSFRRRIFAAAEHIRAQDAASAGWLSMDDGD